MTDEGRDFHCVCHALKHLLLNKYYKRPPMPLNNWISILFGIPLPAEIESNNW